MSQLKEYVDCLTNMPAAKRAESVATAREFTKHLRWIPNPGPQTDAYMSQADVLLYGGEPGGGKSSLVLGLAFNCHRRSLIMRRQYKDLERLTEDAISINGSRNGYNGSPPPKLRVSEGQVIQFGAANNVGDEQGFMGQGRDFLGIDEATHFAKEQIQFLMGWNRTETPGQRVRTVLATNPALTAEGLWVNVMFAPWLDDKYLNPAKYGELRWAVTDEYGDMRWVDGPGAVNIGGKMMEPKSYTYIPASVKDNPYYAATGYERELDAMPEPYRSILMGGFKTTFQDLPDQVIPTAWVEEAFARWTPKSPEGIPMCALSVDCSGGGADPMVIATRHDGWYAPLIRIPGREMPQDELGSFACGQVVTKRKDRALVIVDMGGGYGGSLYERLKENDIQTYAYKGAEKTQRRSSDGTLHFTNTRSGCYWMFREALDPDQPGGSPIALQRDPKLLADLTAPTFKPTANGIKVEPKEDVCKRLGRSTDDGDATVMAWWEGDKMITSALEWAEAKENRLSRKRTPKVILGGRMPMTGRRR